MQLKSKTNQIAELQNEFTEMEEEITRLEQKVIDQEITLNVREKNLALYETEMQKKQDYVDDLEQDHFEKTSDLEKRIKEMVEEKIKSIAEQEMVHKRELAERN